MALGVWPELWQTNAMATAIDRINTDPDVMMGKPCVNGTRITVDLILDKLAAGESADQIVKAHPRLVMEDIKAALAFAATTVRDHYAA
jgi:uncharacterized protein (DUF433 family)